MGQKKGISEIEIWRRAQTIRSKAKQVKTGNQESFFNSLSDVGNLNSYIRTSLSCVLRWQP